MNIHLPQKQFYFYNSIITKYVEHNIVLIGDLKVYLNEYPFEKCNRSVK